MRKRSDLRPTSRQRRSAKHTRAIRAANAAHSINCRPLRFEPLEDRRVLSTVTVTTLEDKVDFTDGLTSLREAIFATNTVPGADEITFAPSLTASGPATILLTQGELKITDDLTITGPGADLLTIDASGNDPTPDENNGDGSRIFNVDDGNAAALIDVFFAGVTLTGGDIKGVLNELGSAIRSLENLTLISANLVRNAGFQSLGPAIYSVGGSVDVRGSTIADNTGMGIYLYKSQLTLVDSVVANNSIDPRLLYQELYAGVYIRNGSAQVINSKITGNQNGFGLSALNSAVVNIEHSVITGNAGGVSADGEVTIIDTIISNNFAVPGPGSTTVRSLGGLISHGSLRIERSTISGNVNTANGFSAGGVAFSGKYFSMLDCIIADNIGSDTVGGARVQSSFLLVANTQILNNRNSRGLEESGVFFTGTTVRILQSTISENVGDHLGAEGVHIQGKDLLVEDCVFSDNSEFHFASNGGVADIRSCTFIRTSVRLAVAANGSLSIVDCSITDGTCAAITSTASGDSIHFVRDILRANADFLGDGIYVDGNVSVDDSTIEGYQHPNSGSWGGEIHVQRGELVVQNTIIRNNSSGAIGGGIKVYEGSRATIRDSSIIDNTAATDGGGIFGSGGLIELHNSIIAKNSAPSGRDVTGWLDSSLLLSHSLLGSNQHNGFVPTLPGVPDANGNLIGGATLSAALDPKLSPLADYGGETMPDGSHRLTHALLPGSPAINAGEPAAVAGVGNVPIHDGRGAPFTRIYGGRIDIGAFELQPTNILVGDYNRDGQVNSADYNIWRNTTGSDGAPGDGADGNFDGIVDRLDYTVWKNNFGATTANLGPIPSAASTTSPVIDPITPPTSDSSTPIALVSGETPSFDHRAIAAAMTMPAARKAVKSKLQETQIDFAMDTSERALLAWLADRPADVAPIHLAAADDDYEIGEHDEGIRSTSAPSSLDLAFAAML